MAGAVRRTRPHGVGAARYAGRTDREHVLREGVELPVGPGVTPRAQRQRLGRALDIAVDGQGSPLGQNHQIRRIGFQVLEAEAREVQLL